MEYQSYPNYINTFTDNSTPIGKKVGEMITFDGSEKTRTEMEIYDCYGFTCYNPAKTIPYGGYAKTKYTQLPQKLTDFTREFLKTDLVDILASNTGSLIIILKTPADLESTQLKDKPTHEPEFMLLERFGICQGNGAIHWRNRPISSWLADRQLETDDYLLKLKFSSLSRVSQLFDLVVGILDRRDYSLRDTTL
jgi:hypothetical protein